MSGFSGQNFDELAAWLMRRGRGIPDIVTLEGFLTAIVVGPNTLPPTQWLARVWGGRDPHFRDPEELNQFIGLVLGFYNELVGCFASDPASFEPSFYEQQLDDQTVVIVDEWCDGFIKGTRLDTIGWKPLVRERPELLKPMQLFGTRAGWRELAAGGEADMHRTWSVRIAPAVREIYAYWLPRRIAMAMEPENVTRH